MTMTENKMETERKMSLVIQLTGGEGGRASLPVCSESILSEGGGIEKE